jgi:uncharacterized protein YbjT (DUF2867 family)
MDSVIVSILFHCWNIKCSRYGVPHTGFAVENVVDYLVGAMKNPETAGKILEIGGPDTMTYEQLMRLYSSILNRNLMIIQIHS